MIDCCIHTRTTDRTLDRSLVVLEVECDTHLGIDVTRDDRQFFVLHLDRLECQFVLAVDNESDLVPKFGQLVVDLVEVDSICFVLAS